MSLVKGKWTIEGPNSKEVVAQHETTSAKKNPPYPSGFTPLHAQIA